MFGRALLEDFGFRAKFSIRRPLLAAERAISAFARKPESPGFFDTYPLFATSMGGRTDTGRLNQRYRACIEWNDAVIRGQTVLDLASHNGRWSFAAIKSSAKKVVGIEADRDLVRSAKSIFETYEVPRSLFELETGDVFDFLDGVQPGAFDTILCMGFFCQTQNHLLLLSKIERLRPNTLILDTGAYIDRQKVIALYEVPSIEEGVRTGGRMIGGTPSRAALEFMLDSFGWSYTYYDWHAANIARWDGISDYHEGTRLTLRVNCRPSSVS